MFRANRRARIAAFVLAAISICAPAHAQQTFKFEESVSICIDPPQSPLVVQDDVQKQGKDCRRWSQYSSLAAVIGIDSLKNCSPTVPAVNQFAANIVSAWTGNSIPSVSTARLFDDAPSLGLRELRSGETRSKSLVVWKGGVVGIVMRDEDASAKTVDLAKLSIVYPSHDRCGVLNVINARTLAATLVAPDKFKLLRYDPPLYFWNHWIEGDDVEIQTDPVSTQGNYRYRIDFSPLDFHQFIMAPNASRQVVAAADTDVLLPRLGRLKILVLPAGTARLINGDAMEVRAAISDRKLRQSLSAPGIATFNSPSGIAAAHGALRALDNNNTESLLQVGFYASEPGCGSLKVVVWKEDQGLAQVVANWERGFRAVAPTSGGRSVIVGDDDCGERVEIARKLDPSAIPSLAPTQGPLPDVRLTFLDVRVATMGFLEDLTPGGGQVFRWVLERKLGEHLPKVVADVDGRIRGTDFNIDFVSKPLADMLFACQQQSGCEGSKALARLLELAEARPSGTRVEAVFRDSSGGVFYVPIHLLPWKQDKLLGERIRPVLALPLAAKAPNPKAPPPCVGTWQVGLIASDLFSLDEAYRKSWLAPLLVSKKLNGAGYYAPGELKEEYFRKSATSAEGFVLLAHHRGGEIADAENAPQTSWVVPDQMHRTFVPGSFGVFAACSVGALGQDAIPKQPNSALLLHLLNKNNMQAAIVSPFKVPEPLARSFLDAFRETVLKLTADTPLYVVFESAKNSIKTNNTLRPNIQSAANIFMLLGDGNISICKP